MEELSPTGEINKRQLKVLLGAYRKIDMRAGALSKATGHRRKEGSSTSKIVLIYGFYGLMFGTFAFSRMPAYLFSIILASYTAIMVSLFITAEAGTLLFNTQDSEVLGHLPISPKTYYRAKCLNLLNYILLIAIPLNLAPAFMGMACRGGGYIYPVMHLLVTLLIACCVGACVVLCYGVLMRYVRKERLQSVITWSQIAITILFVFGYQVVPRVMSTWKLGQSWDGPWWLHLYPPAWFASLVPLSSGQFTSTHITHSTIAVLLAGLSIYLGLQRFASDYQSAMMQFAEGSASPAHSPTPTQAAAAKPTRSTGRLRRLLARIMMVRRPEEHAVFDLCCIQFARDNELKLRLYPSLAWIIGMPLLGVITRQAGDPLDLSSRVSPAFSYFGVVFAGSLTLTVLETLLYTKNPEAAFIFQVCPIERLSAFYSGIRKAVTGTMVLPLVLIMMLLFGLMWHNPLHAIMHVGPWLFVLWTTGYLPFLWHNYLPFSGVVREGQQATRNMGVVLGVMILMGGLAGIQHFSYIFGFYKWFALGVVVIFTTLSIFLSWATSRKRSVLVQD
jgi:hypothetical protein